MWEHILVMIIGVIISRRNLLDVSNDLIILSTRLTVLLKRSKEWIFKYSINQNSIYFSEKIIVTKTRNDFFGIHNSLPLWKHGDFHGYTCMTNRPVDALENSFSDRFHEDKTVFVLVFLRIIYFCCFLVHSINYSSNKDSTNLIFGMISNLMIERSRIRHIVFNSATHVFCRRWFQWKYEGKKVMFEMLVTNTLTFDKIISNFCEYRRRKCQTLSRRQGRGVFLCSKGVNTWMFT